MSDDPNATPNAPSNVQGSYLRPLFVLAILIGIAFAGVYAYRALKNKVLQTPEQRALAEALAGLNDARSLEGEARKEKLRAIMRSLAETRRGKASASERALLDEALTTFGSGDPKRELAGVFDRLLEARGDEASAEERQAIDALRRLAGGPTPTPVEGLPDPPPLARHPASEAKIGQWVLIEHARGTSKPTFTYKWIAAVEEDTATVKVQELASAEDDAWVTQGGVYETFAMLTPLVVPPDAKWEPIEVGDETFRCFRLQRAGKSGNTILTWTSYDVPVQFGLYTSVRQVIQDASGVEVERSQLTRYGGAGGGAHLRRSGK